MKPDRRTSPRTSLRIARIEVEHLRDGLIHLAQGKNLSAAGLLVRSNSHRRLDIRRKSAAGRHKNWLAK